MAESTPISLEEGTIKLNNVTLGKGVAYYGFVNLYGCSVGDESRIGTFVEIQKNAHVGKRCKISSHTFICEGVNIGDDVFVGHGVMFTNDRLPRASSPDGTPLNDGDWTLEYTHVGDHTSIGSNVTIVPGITIGKNVLIGAGSVVTKDLPDNAIAVGNPAQVVRFQDPLPS
uniref:N-acetyltransferase n=1 Tax=Magnetococcus massalia (strain MO-1) TaxID=451514 RepID=A0A1S7LFX8_MAGMO|nr:Conserved protein of unknown function. Putative Acetyltransferase; trimeric LpxA-like enzyme [Candidatus Magnetococcus massalia]